MGHTKATPLHGADPPFNVRPSDPITGAVLDTKTPPGVHGHYNFLRGC
ncbi:HNH/endonuclease VII fold putative polymorphic toxin [Dickeya solani]